MTATTDNSSDYTYWTTGDVVVEPKMPVRDASGDTGRVWSVDESGLMVGWDSGVATPVSWDQIERIRGGVLVLNT